MHSVLIRFHDMLISSSLNMATLSCDFLVSSSCDWLVPGLMMSWVQLQRKMKMTLYLQSK